MSLYLVRLISICLHAVLCKNFAIPKKTLMHNNSKNEQMTIINIIYICIMYIVAFWFHLYTTVCWRIYPSFGLDEFNSLDHIISITFHAQPIMTKRISTVCTGKVLSQFNALVIDIKSHPIAWLGMEYFQTTFSPNHMSRTYINILRFLGQYSAYWKQFNTFTGCSR